MLRKFWQVCNVNKYSLFVVCIMLVVPMANHCKFGEPISRRRSDDFCYCKTKAVNTFKGMTFKSMTFTGLFKWLHKTTLRQNRAI